MSGSSYQALSSADRERNEEGITPSSADLAAMPPALAKALAARNGTPQNPHGQPSPNMNDPRPMKDGADNSPMKDGSKNPPKKTYKGM